MPNIRYTARMSTSGSTNQRNRNAHAPYFPPPTQRQAERNACRPITSIIHHNLLTFNVEFMAVHQLEKLERPLATFFELDIDSALSLINKETYELTHLNVQTPYELLFNIEIMKVNLPSLKKQFAQRIDYKKKLEMLIILNKIRLRGLYNPRYKNYEKLYNLTNDNEHNEEEEEGEEGTSTLIHPPPSPSNENQEEQETSTSQIRPLPPASSPSASHYINRPTATIAPLVVHSSHSSHSSTSLPEPTYTSHFTNVIISDDDDDDDDDPSDEGNSYSPSSPSSPEDILYSPSSPVHITPQSPSSLTPPRPSSPPPPASPPSTTQPPTATTTSSLAYTSSLYHSSVLTPIQNNNIMIHRPPTPFMYFYEGNSNPFNNQFRHIGLTQSNITFDQVPTPQGFPIFNDDDDNINPYYI